MFMKSHPKLSNYCAAWILLLLSLIFIHFPGQAQENEKGLSFAVFADQHYPHQKSKYLTELTKDVMNKLPEVAFGMGLGDAVHDKTRYIGDWKDNFYRNLNLPYYLSTGDHDIVNYQQYDNHVSPFPYKTLKVFMEEAEITTPTYAMLRSNILFLVIGDKGPIEKIHETQKEWIEYMVSTYPDKTTILASHAPVRGTTGGSNRHDWGWRHDEMWWWKLFRDNPQIKAYLNGDGHYMSYVLSDNNHHEGYRGTNGSWGHKIAFIEPPHPGFYIRGNHNINQFAVITLTEETLSTRTWRNEGNGGQWADDFNHTWNIPGGTSYDETAEDWYSFPVFLQDGEQQVLPNDIIPLQHIELQLIGMRSYSLFNNPEIIAGHTKDYEKVSGFGNDQEVAFHREGYMEITGPRTITFPDKDSHWNKEKGGKSGQIKNYLFHGSTPQAIPGESYKITITARTNRGKGNIAVNMSTSAWRSKNQYSTLEGSKKLVLKTELDETLQTFSGIYRVPDDKQAWFLQGDIACKAQTSYKITSFRITRVGNSHYTQDFHLQLGEKRYKQKGKLNENQAHTFLLPPVDLTDASGNLHFMASIGGNRVGMARMVFREPFLYGRNARFRIDSCSGNKVNITLTDMLSRYTGTFKMIPFSKHSKGFSLTTGKVHTTESGKRYGTTVIQPGEAIGIVFPEQKQ
jgi:hypothetical protein